MKKEKLVKSVTNWVLLCLNHDIGGTRNSVGARVAENCAFVDDFAVVLDLEAIVAALYQNLNSKNSLA